MIVKPFICEHCMSYYIYCETQEELSEWVLTADWHGKPELDICSWVGGAKVKEDWLKFWRIVAEMEKLKTQKPSE